MAQTHANLVSTIDPPALGKPNPVYSHITTAPISDMANFITVAGQAAINADGSVPEGFKVQMELCLKHIHICLTAAGAEKSDMTRLMYYVTEEAWQQRDALDIVYQVITPWLEGHRPASCFLVVKSLSQPELLCEFEAQAVTRMKK